MDTIIISRLKQELENSQAKVTGYFLSCVIITEKGTYVGSNKEIDDINFVFEHAEVNALKECLKVESNPVVHKILLCGKGKIKKLKHYIPCSSCCDTLSSYCLPSTEVILVDINNNDEITTFSFEELKESYSYKDIAKLQVSDLQLRERDSNFLKCLILETGEKIEGIFLTGSASGRGGFTSLLRKKFNLDYGDLDLFLVVKQENLEEIQRIVDLLAKNIYQDLLYIKREIPAYQNKKGVVLDKSYYRNQAQDEPILDFTYCTQLDGAFIRKEYFERNWYLELTS